MLIKRSDIINFFLQGFMPYKVVKLETILNYLKNRENNEHADD